MNGAIELARFIGLALYLALWWFACRAWFKDWWGTLHWIPVAYLAFGLPMIVADVLAPLPVWRARTPALFAAYLTIPAVTVLWQFARGWKKERTNHDRPAV
jgi:hypothetical protein